MFISIIVDVFYMCFCYVIINYLKIVIGLMKEKELIEFIGNYK